MSCGGIGDAAAMALYELAKAVLQSKSNKNATKKDIQELKELLTTRYFPIYNLPYDQLGRAPYFDMKTGNVEYFNL